jgi:hypothetical protein
MMRKVAMKVLVRALLICMLIGSLLSRAIPVRAVLPETSYLGEVTAIDAIGSTMTIQTDSYWDWYSGGWIPYEGTLESQTLIEDALDEIEVGDYVEARCIGACGQCSSYVMLGKMESETQQFITDIYGDPRALISDMSGNYRIEYENTPDCSNCGVGLCEAKYTVATIVRQGNDLESQRLYPGESFVYEGEHWIDVTFNHGEALAYPECTDEPYIGPQPFSDFTVHTLDATPPATIDDLTATPGTYPGDIILSWTAPGDDGNTGTASLYEIKWDTQSISSESDWTYAFDVDGEPTPLLAGTTQTMTVTKTPGVTLYFAIRARDEVGNWGGISSFPSVKAPGMLISDINEQLEKNPSAILGQQVTVLVMPVRTTDLTLGAGDWGETVPALKSLHEICKVFFTKQGAAELAAHGGIGGLLIATKAALIHQTLDNWLQMRAQLVWGIHEGDLGDRTLLVWDPAAPLMNHGVPYVVTGTVSKKTFFDVLALKNDYFYHLKVEHSSDQVIQQPSTTHPHFTIPAGYTYRKWEDIQLDGVTGYGDQICTIGLVTERYPVGGHHYVRIQLMERISGALPVRVPTDAKAPDMGAMALYCGTKRAAGGGDLHPGWLPLSKYLDTTTGDGSVQLLQGYKSQIERHECPSRTFLGIEIGSPADIHVYDPEGNHVGVVYDGSNNVIGVENEIPDVEYFYGVDDAPEFMGIGNPTAGVYTVTIHGTDTGTYTQTIRIYDSSGGQTFASTVTAQPISAGQEDTTVVDEIPAAPTGLEVSVDGSTVNLDWDDNTESDLAGYNVYRSTQVNGVYQKMNSYRLSASSFTDNSADEYTAYYYYVTAEDTGHNESGHLTPVVSRYLIYLPRVLRNH